MKHIGTLTIKLDANEDADEGAIVTAWDNGDVQGTIEAAVRDLLVHAGGLSQEEADALQVSSDWR